MKAARDRFLLELAGNPFLTVALAIVTVPLLPIGYWLHERRAQWARG